jgi:P-type E1-E2 ATPase
MKPTEVKPDSKPVSKFDAQKNLKSVPMADLEKKLGSSPDGLSQAEAQKRLTQYGPQRDYGKERKSVPKVKRGGKWTDPAAKEPVPGDVIRLKLGDIVPADARLLPGDPVEVDQSALTGESLPTTKKPSDAVFSGSIIRQGESEGMIYATGTDTYYSKTAQMVQGRNRSAISRKPC